MAQENNNNNSNISTYDKRSPMNTSGLLLTEAEHLTAKFGSPNHIAFTTGRNGFTKAVLTNPKSQSALEVYLHGAHITSWTTKVGEHIFLSDRSAFEKHKAIRGGIPICWPQFGPGPLQAHGFARNITWDVAGASVESDGSAVHLVLELKERQYTTDMWPHSFIARLSISLSSKLDLGFSVANTGSDAFSFQLALHSYFSVSSIDNVSVVGLKDLEYIDKVREAQRTKETKQVVTIAEEVDRVYIDVKDTVKIVDKGRECTLYLERNGLPDVVVWNPWVNKARSLADLGEEAYPKFICVEVGVIDKPIKLEPGQKWAATHTITAPASPAAL